jgi:23S rRNA pseudouridine1911/1915/1917 synthase
MIPSLPQPYSLPPEHIGKTLAAVLRILLPGTTWKQVRALIAARRVEIDDALCLDPARRLKEGEVVACLQKPAVQHRGGSVSSLVIRHLDEDVVVVEKASGVNTVRHPAEREWNDRRRALEPTLEDLTQFAIAERLGQKKLTLPRLRIVQRLDKDTSGLVVFARSVAAERGLGKQFHAHSVIRKYIAIVRGNLQGRTFSSWFVRDRGDGRRGSAQLKGVGKLAITHVAVVEQLPNYAVVSCQLETGRTHQIRIHLAEAGHSVCGEKVYNHKVGGEVVPDQSGAPRLALHAAELGFQHPITGESLLWEMPLPLDLQGFLEHLRRFSPRNE